MKKISTVLLALAVIGIAGPQLSYGMGISDRSKGAGNITELSNPEGCQFIKDLSLETAHGVNVTDQIKTQTYNAGGNAYQIISQPQASGANDTRTDLKNKTRFRVYKCPTSR